MTFIDRLETDLIRACDAQIAPRRSWTPPLQRLSRRARLRTLAGLSVVAAIMAPAVAIGLGPVLRDFEGQRISASAEAPPAEQLALLGILREPPRGTTPEVPASITWLNANGDVVFTVVNLGPVG
jgi:hypothetical protein